MTTNNSSELFSRPNASAIIYDLEHFTFWADTPDRPGYRSRLVFGERNGAPRLTLFPNTEDKAPVVWIGMTPFVFDEFLLRFEQIANGENGKSDKVANRGPGPNTERGKPPKESDMVIRNYLRFGKDREGVCWLAIEQQGIKNILFQLLPSAWHFFHKADGTPIEPKEASVAHTLSVIRCLRAAMAPYIARLRPMSDKALAREASGALGATPGGAMTTFGEDVQFGS